MRRGTAVSKLCERSVVMSMHARSAIELLFVTTITSISTTGTCIIAAIISYYQADKAWSCSRMALSVLEATQTENQAAAC